MKTQFLSFLFFVVAVAAVLIYTSFAPQDAFSLAILCFVLAVGFVLATLQWLHAGKKLNEKSSREQLLRELDSRLVALKNEHEAPAKLLQDSNAELAKRLQNCDMMLNHLVNVANRGNAHFAGGNADFDARGNENLSEKLAEIREKIEELSATFADFAGKADILDSGDLNVASKKICGEIESAKREILDAIDELTVIDDGADGAGTAEENSGFSNTDFTDLNTDFTDNSEEKPEDVPAENNEREEAKIESSPSENLPDDKISNGEVENFASLNENNREAEIEKSVPAENEEEIDENLDEKIDEKPEEIPEESVKSVDESVKSVFENSVPAPVPAEPMPEPVDLPHTILQLTADFPTTEPPQLRGNAPLSQDVPANMEYSGGGRWRYDFGPIDHDVQFTIFKHNSPTALGDAITIQAGKHLRLKWNP